MALLESWWNHDYFRGDLVAQLETDRNKGVEESVSRIAGELSQHRCPSPVCGRSRVITAPEN